MNKTHIPLGNGVLGVIIPEQKCDGCKIRMYFNGLRFVVSLKSDQSLLVKQCMGFVCYKCGANKKI